MGEWGSMQLRRKMGVVREGRCGNECYALGGRSARKASAQLPKLLSSDKTLVDDLGIDKLPGTEYMLLPYPSFTEMLSAWGLHLHDGSYFESPKRDLAKGIVVTVQYSNLYKLIEIFISRYYHEFSCWEFKSQSPQARMWGRWT